MTRPSADNTRRRRAPIDDREVLKAEDLPQAVLEELEIEIRQARAAGVIETPCPVRRF